MIYHSFVEDQRPGLCAGCGEPLANSFHRPPLSELYGMPSDTPQSIAAIENANPKLTPAIAQGATQLGAQPMLHESSSAPSI